MVKLPMYPTSQRSHDAPAQQLGRLVLVFPIMAHKNALTLAISIECKLITVGLIARDVFYIMCSVELVSDIIRESALFMCPLEVPMIAARYTPWAIFPSLKHILGTLTCLCDDEA